MAELQQFAHELAECSRRILNAVHRATPQVEVKSDASPVTETDRLVERELRALIERRYPQHGILGEEYGPHNEGAEHVWVIDPIDGTLAFVAGVPVYGTLIGLAEDQKPILGVIDHPATEDRWIGGPEIGATWNGDCVSVRSCAALERAFLTTSNIDFYADDEAEVFRVLRQRAELTLYGASCYAYGLLASGRTDIGMDAGFDVFDAFAPAAVIQGAGGFITDWNGAPIDLGWSGRFVACGDQRIHEAALAIFAEAGFD